METTAWPTYLPMTIRGVRKTQLPVSMIFQNNSVDLKQNKKKKNSQHILKANILKNILQINLG